MISAFFSLRVVLLCFILLWTLTGAEIKSASTKHQQEESKDIHKATDKDEHVDRMKVYQQLLKNKRMEQVAAVKSLVQLKDMNQQKKIVGELISSMTRLLMTAQNAVMAAKVDPTLGQFPNDEALKGHVSEILENTPFFLEFALYYPRVVSKYYNEGEIKDLILWAYKFSMDFNLYDTLTLKMIDLASQELRIVDRREDFINPYDKIMMRDAMQAEAVAAAKEARERKQKEKAYSKKSKKNGPSLSRSEL